VKLLPDKIARYLADRIKTFLPGPGGVGYSSVTTSEVPQDYETLELAYAANTWVNRCVSVISSTMSDVPLRVYRETGKGADVEREEVFVGEHVVADLLWSPSPRMSGVDFIRRASASLALNGEALIFVENGSSGEKFGGVPERLQLLKSRFIEEVKVSQVGIISGYVYSQMGQRTTYAPEFVVHPMNYNPFDDTRGLSPIKIAQNPILMEYYLMRHNSNFFKNGATPSGTLTATGFLDDASKERNLKAWYKAYGSDGKRARGIAHLDAATTFQDTASTAKDGEFIALDKLAMTEILAVFGVPPFIVGDLDRANFANSTQQLLAFYQYTIKPMGALLQDAINNQFIDVWFGKDSGLYVEFDYSGIDVLQEDQERKARIHQIYLREKVLTRNEVRLDLQMEPIEGGDDFPEDPFAGLFAGGTLSTDRPTITKGVYRKMSREDKWRAFADGLTKQESKFAGAMRSYFNQQAERIEQAINQLFAHAMSGAGVPESVKAIEPNELFALFDLAQENEELRARVTPLIRSIVNQAGANAAKLIGDPSVWNVTDPRVANLIAGKILKITRVNNTTKDMITAILVDASNSNLTISETARQIRDMFEDMTPSRSMTIARTEVIGANNGATMEGFAQSGVEKKEWLSSRDADVRDSHQVLDGEVVEISNLFSNGMQYPGGDGPPEEVINCRCTVLAVLE
jgi:HK97 family phage portal protein